MHAGPEKINRAKPAADLAGFGHGLLLGVGSLALLQVPSHL